MTPYIIYGLIDPRDGHLRYVGKSSSGLARPRQHKAILSDTSNIPKIQWVAELLGQNLNYMIAVLHECEREDQLNDEEKYYISYFRYVGCNLLNKTDGGDGGQRRNPVKLRDFGMPPYREAKRQWEILYFEELLEKTAYNMSLAAKISGMHRSTLYEKIARYKLI